MLTPTNWDLAVHDPIKFKFSSCFWPQTIIEWIKIAILWSVNSSFCPSWYLSINLSIYLYIYGFTVLLLDLGRFFSFFSNLTVGRTPWGGISPTQGHYLHTEQHQYIINASRHLCLGWDWNPRSQCSSGRRQFMPLWSAILVSTSYKTDAEMYTIPLRLDLMLMRTKLHWSILQYNSSCPCLFHLVICLSLHFSTITKYYATVCLQGNQLTTFKFEYTFNCSNRREINNFSQFKLINISYKTYTFNSFLYMHSQSLCYLHLTSLKSSPFISLSSKL
jgi:hypothetical protein